MKRFLTTRRTSISSHNHDMSTPPCMTSSVSAMRCLRRNYLVSDSYRNKNMPSVIGAIVQYYSLHFVVIYCNKIYTLTMNESSLGRSSLCTQSSKGAVRNIQRVNAAGCEEGGARVPFSHTYCLCTLLHNTHQALARTHIARKVCVETPYRDGQCSSVGALQEEAQHCSLV